MSLRSLTPLTALLTIGIAFHGTNQVRPGHFLPERDSSIVLGNGLMRLTFDKQTGEWQSWIARPLPGNLLTPNRAYPTVDVSINGVYLIAQHGATLIRQHLTQAGGSRNPLLTITVGILPQGSGYAYELTSYYRLNQAQKGVERWARLVRNKPGATEHFDGFRFQLPGVGLAARTENTLTVPGPFFPKTFVAANTPYDSLKTKQITFHGAPDAGFGLLILANQNRQVALGSWMSTRGEVSYQTAILGNGQSITFRHDDKRAYYLKPAMVVESDRHWLELSELPGQVMQSYRRMCTETMPLDKATPDWVKDQVILEIYPKYFKGGLRELTSRLPFYKDAGFTMIYLMPHWEGGYSPIDPFRIEPKFGSAAELKALVDTAHGLGLKVIFDMVIHGFNEKSPLPKQKPELFVRSETGELARHPTWKSITTDWASPAYQQYMVDLVLHDQHAYGNDGYRVDAATYKGAGWNPAVPYPAYRDGSAAPELMNHMLTALRQRNPDAVLLSEVFGPVFYSVCNFAHDNQTEAVAMLLERMQRGSYTAADYKQHLLGVYTSLPKGANRVFYARNHDTSWFYHFNGYTPRFMAFEAVHTLFGIPEVFAGDPDYQFNPDDDSTIYHQYKQLFAFRKQRPEWTRGAIQLQAVSCDNKQVFSGVRSLNGQASLMLVSFSDRPEKARITLHWGKANPAVRLALRDVQTGQLVGARVAGRQVFTITLQPFQTLAGRVE